MRSKLYEHLLESSQQWIGLSRRQSGLLSITSHLLLFVSLYFLPGMAVQRYIESGVLAISIAPVLPAARRPGLTEPSREVINDRPGSKLEKSAIQAIVVPACSPPRSPALKKVPRAADVRAAPQLADERVLIKPGSELKFKPSLVTDSEGSRLSIQPGVGSLNLPQQQESWHEPAEPAPGSLRSDGTLSAPVLDSEPGDGATGHRSPPFIASMAGLPSSASSSGVLPMEPSAAVAQAGNAAHPIRVAEVQGFGFFGDEGVVMQGNANFAGTHGLCDRSISPPSRSGLGSNGLVLDRYGSFRANRPVVLRPPPLPPPDAVNLGDFSPDLRSLQGDYIASSIKIPYNSAFSLGGDVRIFLQADETSSEPVFVTEGNNLINTGDPLPGVDRAKIWFTCAGDFLNHSLARDVPRRPARTFQIWYGGKRPLKISNNVYICGIIYAPNAEIYFGPGNVMFYGCAVGKRIIADGNVCALYDPWLALGPELGLPKNCSDDEQDRVP